MDRTHDGRAFKTLNIIDEYSRECMAIRVKRKINSFDVLETLADLFLAHGRKRSYALIMALNL
jgi:hypothetical protein